MWLIITNWLFYTELCCSTFTVCQITSVLSLFLNFYNWFHCFTARISVSWSIWTTKVNYQTVEVVQPADPLAPPDEVFQGGPLGKTELELLCLDCTPDLAGWLDWCKTIEVGVNGGLKPYSCPSNTWTRNQRNARSSRSRWAQSGRLPINWPGAWSSWE